MNEFIHHLPYRIKVALAGAAITLSAGMIGSLLLANERAKQPELTTTACSGQYAGQQIIGIENVSGQCTVNRFYDFQTPDFVPRIIVPTIIPATITP
jgi:hypothetical protein